nr:hypothetical protein [Actinomycetes bacterium]
AYVVMQLLPALSKSDQTIAPAAQAFMPFFERHGYFLAVVGIVVFYANASNISRSRSRSRVAGTGRTDTPAESVGGARHSVANDSGATTTPSNSTLQASRRAFFTSMVLMAVFNSMVAYSLADPADEEVQPIVLFVITLALFYFVADESLHANYADDYHRWGRWILSAALLVGWIIGNLVVVPATALAMAVAFFAGGLLVTVLGRELQPTSNRRVWAFALGALAYGVLLMLLRIG